MSFTFKKAAKSQAKLRLGLMGPPGAGKTWTALSVAEGLGGKIALLDTENASASKYADRFSFDTVCLSDFAPKNYVDVIRAAADGGYDVLIIDSLSHAWGGKGGALEMADNASKRSKSGNTYTAWRDVTPAHNAMVDAIVQAPLHIIATLRTKVDYVLETINGKQVPKKVGLAPITGKGLEYEFDIVFDMDDGGKVSVTKTRYHKLTGKSFAQPGPELGRELAAWLSDGAEAPPASDAFQSLLRGLFSASSKEELTSVAVKIKEAQLPVEEISQLRAKYREMEGKFS